MQAGVKLLETIELGGVNAEIGLDPVGRRCLCINFGDRDHCLSISQVLMLREVLDAAMPRLVQYVPAQGDP